MKNPNLSKYDVRSPIVGNRFVVFDGSYKIARFAKRGDGRPFVRVGKTGHATLEDALALLPNVIETIRRSLVKLGPSARVASHLHGDAFVITRPGAGGWQYYKARLTSSGVEVSSTIYQSRGAACVQVQREGGPTPTVDLSQLPSRPLGLYA